MLEYICLWAEITSFFSQTFPKKLTNFTGKSGIKIDNIRIFFFQIQVICFRNELEP